MKKATSVLLAIVLVIMQIPAMTFAAMDNPFKDVKDSAYYYEPIMWAVEKGVTSGTSGTTFSPEDTCTRGQVVTFLWRAAGKPEPTSTTNPFTDVKSTEYYYKAVLWAVEEGVTSGVSATRFGPDEACTRGQVVTFQWRSSGKPDPASTNNPFSDVKGSAYYYDAVLWAVEKSITSGTSATRFSPDSTCTRGQIVTFLSRQFNTAKTEAEEYFEATGEIVEATPVEKSDDVQTEAQADATLEARGFEEFDAMTEYDMDGEFLEEEKEIADPSAEEHPMYYSYYITENQNVWTICITGDRVLAYPASYNMASGSDVITVVSEEDSIVNYDVADNMYYEIIPNDDATAVKKVKKINAATLESLSAGELYAAPEAAAEVSQAAEPTAALQQNSTEPTPVFGSAKGGTVVVSLGDSYSSGEGVPDFYGWTGSLAASVESKEFLAHRSRTSWPGSLIVGGVRLDSVKGNNWFFAASSGAVSADICGVQQSGGVIRGQEKEIQTNLFDSRVEYMDPQIKIFDTIRDRGDTVDYVTMTLGGNDVDFSGIVTKLVTGTYIDNIVFGALDKKLNEKKAYYENVLKYDLKNVYLRVADRTDNKANVIVAGYPRLFDETGRGLPINKMEAQKVNAVVSYFNDQIEALVEETARTKNIPISFVDVETAFKNRGAYAPDAAINPIWLLPKDQDIDQIKIGSAYSIHPNAEGIKLYAECVQAEIDAIEAEKDAERIGEYVTFGSYEQDGDLTNGKEPIEWQILDVKNGNALVISKYALDSVRYNDDGWDSVNWENCSLRKWLNTDFYNEAFGGEGIPLSNVSNAGSVTQDHLFLLSQDEVRKYFAAENDRLCAATPYAVSRGAIQNRSDFIDGNRACLWWLRSSGDPARFAPCVGSDASIQMSRIDLNGYCVRPAMWIDLSSINQ